MAKYIGSEKGLDNTTSKIANKLYEEFCSSEFAQLNVLPFVTLINPITQCFHYYGKEYYKKWLPRSTEEMERIIKIIPRVSTLINKGNILRRWYDEGDLTERIEIYLNNSVKSENDALEIFVDLLLNTPISRDYGVLGQCFHTGIPRFFYKKEQRLYSGEKKYVKFDNILGNNMEHFGPIIDTLEEVFWKDRNVESAIMAPLFLNGQIIGTAFIGDESKEEFTYYDYIRFIKLASEVGITLVKDAKEYEFLSKVLKDLPNNSFNVAISIFKNLPHIFNITGACLKEKNIYKYLSFNKDDNKAFPEWRENPCTSCDKFENEFKLKKTISFDGICNMHENNEYLKPRSCLYVNKENIEFILYFDIDESLLKVYEDSLKLAIDDAFKLIEINDRNVVVHRAYGHDTERLFNIFDQDKCTKEDICYIIDQRTNLMIKLFGEELSLKDESEISFYKEEEILKLWELCRPNMLEIHCSFQLCQETVTLFSSGKPIIKINTEKKVYKPALNMVILNLIRNTFQHGKKYNVKKVNIEIDNNTFVYTQEFNIDNHSEKKEAFSKLPKNLRNYLLGDNVDFEISNKGLGHYILQWICNRFNCKLIINIQCADHYWSITSDSIDQGKSCEVSNYKLSYKIVINHNAWR